MKFLENFNITKKSENYSIKYKDKTLALVSIGVLADIIVDHSKKAFLEKILASANTVRNNSNAEIKALQLEKLYTRLKKTKHRNKNIANITKSSKEFKHFVKAVDIIKRHKVTNQEFLEAQIRGLQFLNDGRGQFPKPNHLSTHTAEDRLLDYLESKTTRTIKGSVERIKLTVNDRETQLMENDRFVAKWELFEDGKADLRDMYFIHDCMMARNGRVTKKVKEYILGLEEANEKDEI